MSKQLRLDVAQLTDVGRKRPHNEDNMAYVIPKDEQVMAKKGALFIVADGMGGHAAGEVASEIAVDTVTTTFYQDENEDLAASLANAIKRANTIIHQRAAENMMRSGMGTTCIAAVLLGNVAYIANVGDSRAYLVRQGQVKQVSQDHSWVEEQVRAGLLTRDQARSHAQRNVITRALGTQMEVEVDVFSEILEEGDSIILCTDGLSGSITEEDLRAIVEQHVPQESVYHLVERANANGGPDNITAIVVRILALGDESSSRPLVRVGGSDSRLSEEATAVLGRVPSSTLSASSIQSARMAASPSPTNSSLFTQGSGVTSPLAVIASSQRKKRARLLFPTLALLLVIILALAGGGGYYFLNTQTGFNQKLDHASSLIDQADPTKNPTEALQKLSEAQKELLAVQGPLAVGTLATRLSNLEHSLQSKGKLAIQQYNQQSAIISLPCNIASSVPTTMATGGSADTTQPSIAFLQNNTNVSSYALSTDSNIYQLIDEKTLTNQFHFSNNQVPLLIVSGGSRLFVLSKQSDQTNPVSYQIHVLKANPEGLLVEDDNSPHPINNALVSDGMQPKLLTAWENDIYVFFAKNGQTQISVADYKVDHLNDDPAKITFSVSQPLISAAAFANRQLFVLTGDGHVKSLNFDSNPTSALDITLPGIIAMPTGVKAEDFQWNSSFTAPPPTSPNRPSFANITGATLLAASNIPSQNAAYLFIVDNTNHRVLQLKYIPPAPTQQQQPSTNQTPTDGTPVATPTQSPGGSAIANPLQYVKQYVSASLLKNTKSIAIDGNHGKVGLLTQNDRNTISHVALDLTQTCPHPQ